MQNNYRTSILTQINRFKGLTPVEIIKERFPDQADLSAIPIGPYSAATFLSIGNHAIESLELAMNTPVWHTLTAVAQGHNEFGHVDINNTLSSYVELLAQKSVEQAAQHLSRLVWYCMASGIWIDEKHVKLPSRTQVKLIADELSLSAKRLEGQLASIDKTSNELTARRQDLVNFTEEKKNELGDIRRGLDEARKQLNELQSILQQATAKAGEVGTVKESAQGVLNEMNVQLGVAKKEFETFKGNAGELLEDQTTRSNTSKQVMEEAQQLYRFIKGKEEEVIKLLGMAADAALGTKYNARGGEIGKGLKFWQWAVPISVVVAVAWVIIVFTCVKTTEFNEWVNLVINLLKTSPAFILMGFVFTHYSKERNLQEEYAFKAAVAMTINTYADILEGKDADGNQSRQQLILNALKQVHTPPRLYGEKGGSLFSLKAKEIRATLGSLSETIESLKPKS
jgi:hypothetical protein